MNREEFEDWKSTMRNCHSVSQEIQSVMEEKFDYLNDEITKICKENGLDVRSVVATEDNKVFTVTVNTDGNEIHFTKKFIDEIGMAFSVKRQLSMIGENELFIELYPLEED